MFPASYLFSYVMPHTDEPIRGADDITARAQPDAGRRRRCRRPRAIERGERHQLHQQIELAKALRPMQAMP